MVTLFVKLEKLNPASKRDPDPRAIQFRDPKYGIELATYLKPMEHLLYELKGRPLPVTRVIGKGLSLPQRATLLREKWDRFQRPVCVSLDASRFDQHVSLELLQIEHSIYQHMNPDRELQRLLSYQLRNRGKSRLGLRYHTRGKRMSGDMNTALGNCVLMVLMVATFMRGRKYDMLDDGDDCLLIVEEEELNWVLENARPTFLEFGHEIKVENVAREFELIEWCQSRPVWTPRGWVFTRNPWKVLSGALTGSKYFGASLKTRRRLVRSVGLGEYILNEGIPILQEFGLALVRNAGEVDALQWDSNDPQWYTVRPMLQGRSLEDVAVGRADIASATRLSFAKAWGLTLGQQALAEAYLRRWAFNLEGQEVQCLDMEREHWRPVVQGTSEVYGPYPVWGGHPT
jgi:hypothetical protein